MNVSRLMTRTGRVVARASKQIGLKIKSAIKPASQAEQSIDLNQPLQTIPERKKFTPQPESNPVDNKPKTQNQRTRLPLQESMDKIDLNKAKIMYRKKQLAAEKNKENEQKKSNKTDETSN